MAHAQMKQLNTAGGSLGYYSLETLANQGHGDPASLPFSIRILLENLLRHSALEGGAAAFQALKAWNEGQQGQADLEFMPARVLLQDFTGVPAVVDLAALRSAMARQGGDPKRINPVIPVDLVIDHSLQVDQFGSPSAMEYNVEKEFQRNQERYRFLRWGQQAFTNFRVVPPATGIIHQINLEYLANVVQVREQDGQRVAFPDSLVGTDSHTTMINGLGVLGWGVGGIEAEAVMLGQPISMVLPEVVGFRLEGALPEGVLATDLVLQVTEILRQHKVVGKFVEFHGPGMASLSLADRTTLANMAPEYGATMGFFPVDDATLDYLRATGRPPELLDVVERYCKTQALFAAADDWRSIDYSQTISLDMSRVEAALAGPKRPQDRIPLAKMQHAFRKALGAPIEERGFGLSQEEQKRTVALKGDGELTHGAVVIASITSCTNTSNPAVMLGAGLLAKNARERGLEVPAWVKTSLAPGSRVVEAYLKQAGLLQPLEELRFHIVGYGCATCIGNSGPLPRIVADAVREGDLVAAAVLSGNRNFEGRVSPLTQANYLASPPLVVAYALAGRVDIDFETEPIGRDQDGKDVFLKEIWPDMQDIAALQNQFLTPDLFAEKYGAVFDGDDRWQSIKVEESALFSWDKASTYVREPDFFREVTAEIPPLQEISGARVLVMVGDSVTTDHISPAGSIAPDSPAAGYLREQGVDEGDFNSYGSRRGNHEVMVRGTFANIRLKNQLVPGSEGSVTRLLPEGDTMSIYAASCRYRERGVPLIVLAGKDYGMGSSRDWAAKGVYLLGVRAVIAESFERIHRSNLIGMGVLPLQYLDGETRDSLNLTGEEQYDLPGLSKGISPGQLLTVQMKDGQGKERHFQVRVRLDSGAEVDYYSQQGILHSVLRRMLQE